MEYDGALYERCANEYSTINKIKEEKEGIKEKKWRELELLAKAM